MHHDDPIFCRRCIRGEAQPKDEICSVCKGELEASYEWHVSWREAWQREKDEKRRKRLSSDSRHYSE